MTDKDAEIAALKAEVARLEAIADDLAERLGQERAVSDELAGEITRLSVRSSRDGKLDPSDLEMLAGKFRDAAFVVEQLQKRAEAAEARVAELEAEVRRCHEVFAAANNNWRHEFHVAVETALDDLFSKLSGNKTIPRASRALLNQDNR